MALIFFYHSVISAVFGIVNFDISIADIYIWFGSLRSGHSVCCDGVCNSIHCHGGTYCHDTVGFKIIFFLIDGFQTGAHITGIRSKIVADIFGFVFYPFGRHITGSFVKITFLPFAVGEPAGCHNASAFCEITFPSLATVYPACGKLTCFGVEIALMAFGICHPAGCHNTLAFCKIVGIFAIDLHPALYLYSGLCVKIVLVSVQGQPAFLFAPVTFYVVCFSTDSFKACSGSLYLFCRSRKDCASHDHQHGKHQPLQPFFCSETLHNFPHFLF